MPTVHMVCDSTADLDPGLSRRPHGAGRPPQGDLRRSDLQRRRGHQRRGLLQAAGRARPVPADVAADARGVRGRVPGAGSGRRRDRLHHHLRRPQRHLRVGHAGARRAARISISASSTPAASRSATTPPFGKRCASIEAGGDADTGRGRCRSRRAAPTGCSSRSRPSSSCAAVGASVERAHCSAPCSTSSRSSRSATESSSRSDGCGRIRARSTASSTSARVPPQAWGGAELVIAHADRPKIAAELVERMRPLVSGEPVADRGRPRCRLPQRTRRDRRGIPQAHHLRRGAVQSASAALGLPIRLNA